MENHESASALGYIDSFIKNEKQRLLTEALTEEEVESIFQEDSRIEIDIRKEGSITPQIYDEFKKIEEAIIKTSYFVETITEFKELAKKLNIDDKQVLHILEHENAHGNVAGQEGFEHLGYGIIAVKSDMIDLKLLRPVCFLLPKVGMLSDEYFEKLKRIANAPNEYGNVLSEGDERVLGRIG